MSAFPDDELPVLLRLAAAMVERAGGSGDNHALPAGYTYFGQFVDHDVTFDTSAPRAGRTPALDLDSVYRNAPKGYGTGRLRRAKLQIGENGDLPREGRSALIGDARNDENLILSQLHRLFLRFHNRVVDHLGARSPRARPDVVFADARALVTRHYQWLIVNDLLPRIIDDATLGEVRAERPEMREVPLTFKSAAYRFGHSAVREDYKLNDAQPNVPLFHPRGDDETRNLGGFRPLPAELRIEWKHFFRVEPGHRPQPSRLIDPWLARELDNVPRVDQPMAWLDLQQNGQDGAIFQRNMVEKRGEALKVRELLDPLGEIDAATRDVVLRQTPLWYFVLCEAKARAGGVHLGPIGGRIVARTLLGLLNADPESYLNREPGWTPAGVLRPQFDSMADFVRYALGT
jgi:hypothetical protein